MDPLWLVLWSGICAVGTGLLVYFVMQSRMEVVLSKQREELAVARTELAVRKDTMLESLRNVEESTRRAALDEFISEIRIEERSYVREHKAFLIHRKSMVRQERIFFRNIPLSNWIETEMPIEEGADIEKLAQTMSVFAADLLAAAENPASNNPASGLLRDGTQVSPEWPSQRNRKQISSGGRRDRR